MYSLIYDFNLNVDGEVLERYLVNILEEWPALYASVPGVRGTAFLLNALGLGGKYAFRQIVDIETPGVIRGIDQGMQSNKDWIKARREWLKYRKEAFSFLVKHSGRDNDFIQSLNNPKETTLVYVISMPPKAAQGANTALRKVRGIGVRSHLPIVQSEGSAGLEIWAVIRDYDAIQGIADATARFVEPRFGAKVFGIMRSVNKTLAHTV